MASPVEHWTEGRFRSFVTSIIRAGFRKFPNKYEALAKAKTGKKVNKATGRMAEHYRCAACKKHFVAKDVQVDHKDPCVDPVVGFVSWDEYIQRMFCEVSNLQILCKGCHDQKTKTERTLRASSKNSK